MTILAVTGLAREAKIVAGPGVKTIVSGGDCARAAELLEAAIGSSVSGVIGIGIAGALDPALNPGDCIVASAILSDDDWFAPDPLWVTRLVKRIPGAIHAPIAGTSAILMDAATKSALFHSSGASACDMESHIVARIANARGIPFAALRTIADRATSDLPAAARVALTADGNLNFRSVFASVVASPAQIPALIRTGRESNSAFYALFRCCRALGVGLAGPDGG